MNKNSQTKQLRDLTSDLGALRKELKEATKPNKKNSARTQRKRRRANAQQSMQSAPVVSSRSITSSQPSFNGGARVVITHKEFIATLNTGPSAGFKQLLRLRMNPGSKKTFSWLSSIGPNFEYFRFRRVVIKYETRASTIVLGSIIISPDYDASDGQILSVTEQSLFNNIGTHDDAIWKSASVPLRNDLLNRLYAGHVVMTDSRFDSSKQDEKTIDPAQVFIYADVDPTNLNSNIGKLYIEYTVELWSPQSRTEDVNQGGAYVEVPDVTVNSTRPFASPNNVGITSEDGILKPLKDLTGVNSPTGTLAQFSRDWSGTMSSLLTATGGGLNNAGAFYVGSDPNSPTGTGDDVFQDKALNAQNVVGPGGSIALSDALVKGLKGQFLKYATSNFNPGTSLLQASLGGSTLI